MEKEKKSMSKEQKYVNGIQKIEEIKNMIGFNGEGLVNVNSNEYKLSEKDKQIESLKEELILCRQINHLLNNQLERANNHLSELKDKLDEKDKEIITWKEKWINSEKEYLELYEKFLKVKESKKCQK